jgi:hypothetical protein
MLQRATRGGGGEFDLVPSMIARLEVVRYIMYMSDYHVRGECAHPQKTVLPIDVSE